MRGILLLTLTMLAGGCSSGGPADAGCTPRAQFAGSAFFHVEQDCGLPRLVAPDGGVFFSFGVNHIAWDGDWAPSLNASPYADAVTARYGTEDVWASQAAARLTDWGWNTAGAWSSNSMGMRVPYTVAIDSPPPSGSAVVADYFDPGWQAALALNVERATQGRAGDALLIGYFVGNELHWGPDAHSNADLLDAYLGLDGNSAGKHAVLGVLREAHHGDIADFNSAWGTAFASFDDLADGGTLTPRGTSRAADADRSAAITAVAAQYFDVTRSSVLAKDPDHLLLGARFIASLLPREVAAAAGPRLDIVSANDYEFEFDLQDIFHARANNFVAMDGGVCLEELYRLLGKAVLVSEMGWRAKDSGLPNSWPPLYPVLDTQADRADRFEAFAKPCLGAPWIVGYHWFQWSDEPAAGRFDGEDDNWGLVNSSDDPYETVTARSRSVNRR